MPIYITQLIYLKEGEESVFDAFENMAIPIIAKYGGKLLLRLRPSVSAIVESNMENPYEIHLVQFESEALFEKFSKDEERKKFLHLKEASVRSVLSIKGTEM